MTRFTLSIFLLFVSFLIPGQTQASKVTCPEMAVILEGQQPHMVGGGSYRERLEMHKVGSGSGYDGQWKVDLFEQENTYTHQVDRPFPIHTNQRVDFGFGQWMQCKADSEGFHVLSRCTGGNLNFDVSGGRIGSYKTNLWIGNIAGNQATLKFDKTNPGEPTITGTVQYNPGGQISLNIMQPSQNSRVVFSENNPGLLEIVFQAQVSPSNYENSLQWDIFDIQGSQKTITPATAQGSQVKVSFKGLPQNNREFGQKKVKVSVDAGFCKAEDSRTISIFYPRNTSNNPGGSEPNWFYYWSQTSAKVGPAKYGAGQNFCLASEGQDGTIGYYRSKYFDSHYYICDLSRLGSEFKFKSVTFAGGVLSAAGIGTRDVTGIDTFAIASQHENAHFRHYQDWWRNSQTTDRFQDTNQDGILDSVQNVKDRDQDHVPDALEPGLGLNPNQWHSLVPADKQHLISRDDEDEEVLCWKAESDWNLGSANKADWAKPGKQWE